MSKQSENVIRWRKRLKRKMIMAMGEKCQCCGYDACDEAMEFHHIDPSRKDFPLSKIRSNPRSLSLITEELKKCILLCSNCHKEVHYNIRQLPSDYAKLDENILISENEIRKNIKRQLSVIPKTPIDRRKIFLSKNELEELLSSSFGGNKSALARYLNVSETAIRKHLNRTVAGSSPACGAPP